MKTYFLQKQTKEEPSTIKIWIAFCQNKKTDDFLIHNAAIKFLTLLFKFQPQKCMIISMYVYSQVKGKQMDDVTRKIHLPSLINDRTLKACNDRIRQTKNS